MAAADDHNIAAMGHDGILTISLANVLGPVKTGDKAAISRETGLGCFTWNSRRPDAAAGTGSAFGCVLFADAEVAKNHIQHVLDINSAG
jgi:hypothetical protein